MKKALFLVFFVLLATIVLTYLLLYSVGKNKNINTKKQDTVIIKEKINLSEPLISKFEILSKLVGEYKLVSISGSMGANTMIDYWIENDKWKGFISSIVNNIEEGISQRDGDDLKLSKKEINKLNSMKIIVNEDLAITFSCENKLYFYTPFKGNGMNFIFNEKADESSTLFPKINTNTTIEGEILYLYYNNNYSQQELSFNEFTGAWADAVEISYDIKSKEFIMNIFLYSCCDNITYTFK